MMKVFEYQSEADLKILVEGYKSRNKGMRRSRPVFTSRVYVVGGKGGLVWDVS